MNTKIQKDLERAARLLLIANTPEEEAVAKVTLFEILSRIDRDQKEKEISKCPMREACIDDVNYWCQQSLRKSQIIERQRNTIRELERDLNDAMDCR